MFDLHWAELENFKSFRGQHRWKIPIAPGLYHLTGFNELEPRLEANGVGKSTLLDAIYWAIFGCTTRGLKAGEIITRGEKGCSVAVCLTVGAAQRLQVKRTQSPNALTLNDQPISQDDLQKQLRLGPDAFTYAVMIPQFGEHFFDLTPAEKLTLFSQIMELDYWLEKSKAAESLANEIKASSLELERQVARYRGQLETIDTDIEELKIECKEFASTQQKEIIDLRKSLSDLRLDKYQEAVEFSKKALLAISKKLELADREAKKCPECGQPIPNKDLEALLKNQSDFERQLNRQKCELITAEHTAKTMQNRIEQERARQNPYQQQIDSKLANKKAAETRLKKLTAEITLLEQDHAAVVYWVNGFKKIRLLVVEQTLRQLEIEINNNMGNLGLTDWRVEFDVERENKSGGVTKGFVVFIYAPGCDLPTKWEAWSGGESQRLRLAGDLGLANLIMEQAGLRNSIEFFDEPSAHLTQGGLLDVAETLHQRALQANKRIFLVDHNAIDFGDFADRLYITKGRLGSRLGRGNLADSNV